MPKESFFVRNHSWSLAKAPLQPFLALAGVKAKGSGMRSRCMTSPQSD
eukprot:COSAG06_NODE_4690_length_4034_cov_220.520457_4_plen_48_part_00